VARLRAYITSEERGWWSADEEQALRDRERVEVLQSLERAEKKGKPALDELFNDVYADMPAHLAKQRQQLLDHMARHPGAYDDAHSGH
jgi:2-oxoisovalerate dehydrogenase E1 component alpha subunit